jgi:hypothetical protein
MGYLVSSFQVANPIIRGPSVEGTTNSLGKQAGIGRSNEPEKPSRQSWNFHSGLEFPLRRE